MQKTAITPAKAITTSELIWQDMQHQELFRILAILATAPEKSVLQRLINYGNDHFAIEEAYMRKLNYPELASHIKSHKYFNSKIKSYMDSQCIFDEQSAIELSSYLTDWLASHIFTVDKDFEAFVLQSEQK
ncbi:hypothetical protein NBRC116592_02090 [Colwellia sp. KU-HH00111]|uniref:hemerythrin family protein n=1 Tax=Colwellia sp. KU-HH00111 TaxID=3127652 RepID=UPI003104A018